MFRVRKVLENITIATWDPDIRNLRGQFSRNWLKNWSEITVSGIYENWWRQEFYVNSAYFRLEIPWDRNSVGSLVPINIRTYSHFTILRLKVSILNWPSIIYDSLNKLCILETISWVSNLAQLSNRLRVYWVRTRTVRSPIFGPILSMTNWLATKNTWDRFDYFLLQFSYLYIIINMFKIFQWVP